MAMMRALVFFLCLSLTPVWAISYTVQLFASSDEARASQLQAELAEQDYPAYLLRVPTAQGQVYRIRVGVFGNRAAAALFAEVLPSVEGSTPSPALAEGGVPSGLIPLQPALLGQYDLRTTLVQIFPWPVIESTVPETPEEIEEASAETTEASSLENTSSSENTSSPENTTTSDEESASDTTPPDAEDSGETDTETTLEDSSESSVTNESTGSETAEETAVATEPTAANVVAQADDTELETEDAASSVMVIRVQPKDASEQAHYRVGDLEFEAWRAAPLEDGWILRVRSFLVWPEDWQNASEAERDQYRETVLANLSGDLDLTPQQLEPFVFEPENKAPFVVLVERFNPETQQVERLRSIGQPRPNQDNLGLLLEGPSTFLGEAVDILSPDDATLFIPNERTPLPETLSGNGWQAKSDGDFVTLSVGDKTWRAAVGQPLWASGDLLISFYESQILLYNLQKP